MAALRTASHQTLLHSRFGSRLLRSGRGNPNAVLERALTRRHESALVVDTMYRSLLGRPASPEELATMRSRASHGVGFDELLADLVTSDGPSVRGCGASLPKPTEARQLVVWSSFTS